MRKEEIKIKLDEYIKKHYEIKQENFECLYCDYDTKITDTTNSKPFKVFVKKKNLARTNKKNVTCKKCVSRANGSSRSSSPSLKEYIKVVDESFIETIFKIIDKRKLDDVDVYKKANIDRKLFSKLRAGGHPSKITAISLCIALKLSYNETMNLLARAGYTLSKSVLFDVIISFFIENKEYRIDTINQALLENDQKTLGPV